MNPFSRFKPGFKIFFFSRSILSFFLSFFLSFSAHRLASLRSYKQKKLKLQTRSSSSFTPSITRQGISTDFSQIRKRNHRSRTTSSFGAFDFILWNRRMDSAVVVVVDPSVGEKRSAENDCDDNNKKKKKKKARFDDGSGDLKKVAEIVLVLSALGKMRSGRCPSLGEKKLMAEAREKLAEMCQGIAPKDILPINAGRVLIEDLGLNSKSRDQKLGFLPPKMSIADKLLLTKKKMEDSKKFAAQSGTYSSQLPKVGFAAKPEIHGTLLQASPRTVPNVPRHITVPVGGVQPASPMVHVFALASPTSNKLPGNEMRPAMVSKGLPSSSLPRGSSSLPLVQEAAHSKINGMVYASQIRAKSSGGNLLEKAPTFSSQPQAGIAARVGASEKVSNHNKVEGTLKTSSSQVALQIARDQNSKPSVIHTAYGNLQSVHQPSQGTNLVNVSKLSDNHKDAARNVQKFLQQKLPVNPSWTPPSTDYMNKSLACQICKVAINNIESLLVCDGCEKGVHLKCLQSYYQKPIPKGEWHCPQCLISNCGKPLPSKYGRVAKNIIAQKVFPTSSEVHTSSEVKAEKPELKVIPQKITANGPSPMNPSHAGITGSKPASDLKVSAVQQMPADKFSASRMNMDDGLASDRKLVLKEITGVVSVPHSGKPNESSSNNRIQNSPLSPCNFKKSTSDPNILPKLEPGSACPESLSDTAIDTCPSPLALCISQDVDSEGVPKCAEVSSNQCQEIKISDFRETSECYSDSYVRQADQNVAEKISTDNLDIGNTTRDCTPLDGLHSVDWVGDILQVVDEKAFYQSCCINGVVYKLQDHALFHSNNDNVRPSKLKALWENTKTKLKWAIVNRCYMPDDLPEVIGRPCTPENNEVYESNHDSTVRAGLIQGPCEVLSPNRFKEESERRVSLSQEPNNGLQPVFLCKWFYDEPKGLFQPISD